MKTLKATIVTGIQEGYKNLESSVKENSVVIVGKEWQKIALKYFEETGIYISCIANASSIIYNSDWGCPVGGESGVTLTTSANLDFKPNDIETQEWLDKWKQVLVYIVKDLKCALKQSTITIEINEIDLLYFK